MAFPPNGTPMAFLPNMGMPRLIIPGMVPMTVSMSPMGGLIPMMNPNMMPHNVSGITVPTGVGSVSAPPMKRTIQIQLNKEPEPVRRFTGNPIVCFVSNITDQATDLLIRHILTQCGQVVNWKRTMGSNNEMPAFGFCHYADPEAALRAKRLLNGYQIGDKKLNVKINAKDEPRILLYLQEDKKDATMDDVLDEVTKKEDERVIKDIEKLVKDNHLDGTSDGLAIESAKKAKVPIVENKQDELADMELEEGKREIINREIDKFRDTYKVTEEKEKEASRRDDYKDRNDRDLKRDRSRERDRIRKRNERPRDRDRERDRDRDRDNDRDRDRDLDRRTDGRRDREAPSIRSEFPASRSPESEEVIQRRLMERELKDKENSYQRRLRAWEIREERKTREYDEREVREEKRKKREEDEMRRLEIFFQDYDDEVDDVKYYRNNSMKERRRERMKEMDEDERDKMLEKKEYEEIKRTLEAEGHDDPEEEARKRMEVESQSSVAHRIKKMIESAAATSTFKKEPSGTPGEVDNTSMDSNTPHETMHITSFSLGKKLTVGPNGAATSPATQAHKRTMSSIFGPQDEEEVVKKRKLPTLEDEDSRGKKNHDEIKKLINEIPVTTEELFAFPIEWDQLDSILMEKRVRPWINKKITEFIGESEEELLDYICDKINNRKSAQDLKADVEAILDDEAETFTVKLWRLIIYEIKAKKAGLSTYYKK